MEGFSTTPAPNPSVAELNKQVRIEHSPHRIRPTTSVFRSAEPLRNDRPEDRRTRSTIRERLVRNIGNESRRIVCIVEEGRVTLRGVVCSYYRKQLAQEAAMRTDGVCSVHNELEVLSDELN